MDRWYVVQTKNKLEGFAEEHLKRQGFNVFYPAYQKIVQRNQKVLTEVHPFYPSYLFVSFDIEQTRWRSINGTRGVVGLVCYGEDWVSPLPAGLVEEMQKMLNHRGFIDMEKGVTEMVKYAVGDDIEIKASSFKGLVGKCCECTSDRVTLLLTLLGKPTRVKLPYSAVQPVG